MAFLDEKGCIIYPNEYDPHKNSNKKKYIMKHSIILFTCSLMIGSTSFGQLSKKQMDYNSIKSLCGCYDVEFNFTETFSYSEDSTYLKSKTKKAGAIEWIQLLEDSPSKISLQHILVMGDSSNHFIMKHWRQDWVYENTNFMMFDQDNKWNYIEKSASEIVGQWTQKVFQVDDSPRYEGSGTWVHVDGKSYWENSTFAPLPRREATTRSDYNVTLRRNRHEITPEGWIHDQDNDKIIREKGKEDVVLAQEKGYNTYIKTDDSKCVYGMDWWMGNKEKWAKIRNVWEDLYTSKKNLSLHSKVDGVRMYKTFFDMDVGIKTSKIENALRPYIIK